MNDWQCVYRNVVLHRAEIVKAVLEENDMTPVLLSKKDSAYQIFGHYEVLVSAEEVLESIKIINEKIQFE